MKLVKPSSEIWEEIYWRHIDAQDIDGSTKHLITRVDTALGETPYKEEILNAAYRMIERAGRTCYKSEDKITEDSAKAFVDRMVESKHYAMLEHGTIYLDVYGYISACGECCGEHMPSVVLNYWENPYSKVVHTFECGKHIYITTNLRVITENNLWGDLKYICPPTKWHAKRATVHFICNRQVSHEFVRHRVFSFAQESTRYCNYTKDKFGNELTFIEPCWEYYDSTFNTDWTTEYTLPYVLKTIEENYFRLIKDGWKPQQAATILPNAIKTELVMTGFVDDWKHFFDLRALGTTGAPHPQAKELAYPLYQEFIRRGYIDGPQDTSKD